MQTLESPPAFFIPRDSWVDVDTYIAGSYSGQQKMQICLQYTYGSSNEESSQLVAQCASRVLSGIPIDHYFTLNVKGVGPLADAIGGVRLTPVKSVEKYDIFEGEETRTQRVPCSRVRPNTVIITLTFLPWRDRSVSFLLLKPLPIRCLLPHRAIPKTDLPLSNGVAIYLDEFGHGGVLVYGEHNGQARCNRF